MKTAIRVVAAVAGMLVPTGFASAGIQVMLVPPANAVPIRLETRDDAKEATLYVPKTLLGKAKRLDMGRDKARVGIWPSTVAIAIGLTLASGASGLGFRLINRPGGKALAAILALASVLILSRCPLQANARPPPQIYMPRHPLKVDLPGGNATIRVVEDGDTVRVVVPKSQLTDWAARLKTPEKSAP